MLGYDKKIFSYYQNRIKTQNELLKTIKSALPSSLSEKVHYCVITENKLSLYTDSALWASQLRFYQQNLLESVLKENQRSFEKLQIKIIPKTSEIKSESNQQLPSKKNIFLILDQAENQQDKKLKNALLKLGNTLRKKKSENAKNI